MAKNRKRKRQVQRGRPAKRRRLNVLGAMLPSTELALAVTNPFERSACIPDGGVKGTGCFTVKQLFSLGTGATGTCFGTAWAPNAGSQSFTDSVTNNATPTIAGNWSRPQAFTTVDTLYASARVVSSGLRAKFIGNTLNDQGVIIVGQVDQNVPLSSFNGVTLTGFASLCMNYKLLPLRNGADIFLEPVDKELMDQFAPINTTALAVTAPQTQDYIVFWVYGCTINLTGIIVLECITQFEGSFKQQTINTGAQATSPVEVGWYEKTKAMVKNVDQIKPFVNGGGSMANGIEYPSVLNRAMDFGAKVFDKGLIGIAADYIRDQRAASVPRITYPGFGI